MASLKDSVVFSTFNKNGEILTLLASSIKSESTQTITPSYIEDSLIQIERMRISPLVDDVIDAYKNNNIILLYANNNKVSQAFPFFAAKQANRTVVYVFVNNYGSLAKNKNDLNSTYLNIPVKDLYALMEGAYIAYKLATNPKAISKSIALLKISLQIYVEMWGRILKREYAINTDEETYDRVYYMIARFYIDKIWELNNTKISDSYARSLVKNGNTPSFNGIAEEYDNANVQNVQELIELLKNQSPRLRPLTMRFFTESWLRKYKNPALFSMECLPYLMFTISTTVIRSFIIDNVLMSDIIKTVSGMNNYYPELVKLL